MSQRIAKYEVLEKIAEGGFGTVYKARDPFIKRLVAIKTCSVADEEMAHYGVSSKLNCDWGFLTHLRDKGRAYASRWMNTNFDAIGQRSSVDLRAEFL